MPKCGRCVRQALRSTSDVARARLGHLSRHHLRGSPVPSESEKGFGRQQRSTHDHDSTLEPDPTEVYKAIRAHELMLNEAAAAQERSVIPPLLTLNGGAAVAFLTLLGAVKDNASFTVDVTVARWAVAAWVVGLLLAAIAAWAAASRQASLNQAFRLMREHVEGTLFPELADVVAREDACRRNGTTPARRLGTLRSIGLLCTDSPGWPAPSCSRSAASWPW